MEKFEVLSPEHKEALGASLPAWIAWILAHECDLAPVLLKTIPLLPISAKQQAALLALLEIACPQ